MFELDELIRRLSQDPASNSLVVAAELHRLSAQLRGESLSDEDCLRAVIGLRERLSSSLAGTATSSTG